MRNFLDRLIFVEDISSYRQFSSTDFLRSRKIHNIGIIPRTPEEPCPADFEENSSDDEISSKSEESRLVDLERIEENCK